MFQQFNDARQELQSYILLQTEAEKRMVYFMNSAGNVESKDFNDMLYKGSLNACQTSAQIKMKYLNNAKASSTVDVNGDCIPDLILESNDAGSSDKPNLEIYFSTSSGFCLVAVQALEDDFLMASFGDFSRNLSNSDKDGSNDLLLVNKKLFAHLFMNKFTSGTSKLCGENTDYSNPFDGFKDTTPTSNHFMFQLPVKDNTQPVSVYLNDNLPGTGVVRMGDINLDGYQDISITIAESGKEPNTYFYKNVECGNDIKDVMNPSKAPIDFGKCRYFIKANDLDLIEKESVYSSSFFDYHELGLFKLTAEHLA